MGASPSFPNSQYILNKGSADDLPPGKPRVCYKTFDVNLIRLEVSQSIELHAIDQKHVFEHIFQNMVTDNHRIMEQDHWRDYSHVSFIYFTQHMVQLINPTFEQSNPVKVLVYVVEKKLPHIDL
jgi:hypothetical protein